MFNESERREEMAQKPTLDELVERAAEVWLKLNNQDGPDSAAEYGAAQVVIKELVLKGINPAEIVYDLTQQAKTIPAQDISDGMQRNFDSWEHALTQFAEELLRVEVLATHPELDLNPTEH